MKLILNDLNFDEEIKKITLPVLVDFYADWCQPCKLIAPIVEELGQTMEGKLVIAGLDIDANQQTAVKYGVMSIPTLIIFKGGQEVKRMVGYQGKEALVNAVNKVLAL